MTTNIKAIALMLLVLVCMTATATADNNYMAVDHGDDSFLEGVGAMVENTNYEVTAYIHDHVREYMQTMSHRQRVRLIFYILFGWPW